MLGTIYRLIEYINYIKLTTSFSVFLLSFILKYIILLLYTTNNTFYFFFSKSNYFFLIRYTIVFMRLVINKRRI